MDNNKFTMVAKTFQGLEDVLCDELTAIGAENVEPGLRMVSFEGDLAMLYRANFCLRSAIRILKPIVKFTAADTDTLYDCVRDTDWSKYLTPDSTFAIDATVNSDDFTHSKYVTYRVKDGIADHFTDRYGRRPSIRLDGADVMLNVHINGDRVTISLDSSGTPLNQRGYRVGQTDAPINEVLAAGIILKTGWRGNSDFIDPMCGSGTFLIEAALIAANIYPGVYRKSFAFERWNDFDAALWAEISSDDSAERPFEHHIYGGDIDPEAIAVARKNINAASLDKMIDLYCRPFSDWTEPPQDGIIVTNPPYGERLKPENMSELYRSIGSTLKQNFAGYHAWILGYREEHFADIGLKPSVKLPMLNGSLECSLQEYVLFNGSYSDFRHDGGSVKNKRVKNDVRPKVRHLSDEEWDEETSKYDRPDRRRDTRRRDFRRENRPVDSKRDRRDDFKRDRRDDFKRDRRDDFKRDRRDDFKRDRRDDFKHDRRDDFKRDRRDDFKREKPAYKSRPATVTPDKGPRIPRENAIDLGAGRIMRSRRGWGKNKDTENQNDNNPTDQ